MNKNVLFRLFALLAAMMCALVMQAAEIYGPLLTAKWNQKEPFWNQCQFTYNGTTYQCLTGPNATAAAMILYYWKYPAAQVDTIPSYTADLYISLFSSINFNYPTLQATTFDWENMIDDYSGDYTSAQADAVAMLIRYVGQAQKTHYGVNAAGSGIYLTDIPNIVDMFTLFGYDPGLCRLVEKSNYSESAWASLIQGELAAGRPVLYMALNTEIGGLIFDVDGYNATNDQYHVNFGFGGDGDGWFAINSITIDGYTFNQSQQAIVGIQPLTEQPCEPYASLSTDGKTLTFYYDKLRSIRPGTTYDLNEENDEPGWCTDGSNTSVTRVEFDPSFADARPTSTAEWFSSMFNLVTIDGLIYLNTSEVTTMKSMFNDCSGVLTADLSGFDTRNVSDMSDMFAFCIAEELDLTSFSTEKVTNMSGMFAFDSSLKTIYVGDEWTTAAVTSSTMMFFGCTSLVGGQGTAFDENHVDAAYAHIDGGTANPGYFTNGVKFNPVMLPANENYIGLTSFRADWTDETPEANVASYTLEVNPKPTQPEVELIASIAGTDFTSTADYYDISLPYPWGGNNLRGAHSRALYFRQKGYQNATLDGQITYTVPEGYENMTFTMKITTDNIADGAGNITVATPQTAAVGHNFSAGETYSWVVTASTGQQIIVTSTQANYSPDIAKLEVYTGDATAVSLRADNKSMLFPGITDKFYTVNNLEAGGTYQYRVKTLYTDGKESAWSNLEEVTLSENAQFLRGDVNGDSSVDITDATMLINYLLSGNASGLNLENANCDQQGGVDISDATALINYLLNGNWN